MKSFAFGVLLWFVTVCWTGRMVYEQNWPAAVISGFAALMLTFALSARIGQG